MKRAALIALAAAAIGAAPAHADPLSINVLFQEFSPSQIDALPGDAITWSNISERTHTVTADGGTFDSGELTSGNDVRDHRRRGPGSTPTTARSTQG